MKLDIRLENDGFRKKKWVLHRDEALIELMGNPISCQKCNSMKMSPFYVCEDDNRWFCKKCTFPTEKKLKKKVHLCNYDKKMIDEGDEHQHICVKEVIDEDGYN